LIMVKVCQNGQFWHTFTMINKKAPAKCDWGDAAGGFSASGDIATMETRAIATKNAHRYRATV
jgi:hypothetical protein